MDINLDTFKKNGYVNIGNVLNYDEIQTLKNEVLNNLNDNNNKLRFSKNLILENQKFFSLLVNSKIISSIKFLCNNKNIFFTPHTDTHINLRAGTIHRDNRHSDRVFGIGNDWRESEQNYNVFRIAIYLTSYQESKTSLTVFPGTHKNETTYQNIWFRFFNKIVRNIHKFFPLIQINQYAPFIKKKILKVNPGDCIIFDKRLRHAGGKISNHADKIAIFFSYGEAENIHTINDFNYLKSNNYITNYPKTLQNLFKINNIKY